MDKTNDNLEFGCSGNYSVQVFDGDNDGDDNDNDDDDSFM